MSSAPIPAAPGGAVHHSIDPVTGKKVWHAGTLTYTMAGVVGLFVLLLVGDFAWSMRDRSVGPMSQWYLSSLKVPNFWFAIIFSSFPALVGLFLGPIISVKSDRHRGKRGRRVPFLLITTPIAAIGMLGVAMTPLLTSWLHATLSLNHRVGSMLHGLLDGSRLGDWLVAGMQNEWTMALVFFAFFWTCFEFATIAGQAVFGGLINDVVPRPLLGRFYGLFRAVSLIDGMIFNYWLMGMLSDKPGAHAFPPVHYFTLIMTAIALFYGLAFMWVTFKVKEGTYPPPTPRVVSPSTGKAGFFAGIKAYFRECFTNPYYILVFVMMMVAGLSFGPINIFALPYAKSLGVDMKVYGHMLALTYAISLTLSFFLGWLADKLHPIRMAIFTLIGYALVTAWGSIYATNVNNFLIAWVLHGVLSGCYFTGAASLGQRLFPHSKFAQFASAAGVLSALGGMVLGPTVGQIIDASGKVYRLTFTSACVLTCTALVVAIIVYFRFMKMGGPKGYVAPGEEEKEAVAEN